VEYLTSRVEDVILLTLNAISVLPWERGFTVP
jgi:hypothetical protein